MPLLNYTTQIAVEKTTAEISRLLAGAKAQAVLTEYDAEGVLVAISFRVAGPHGILSFRLPANVEKVLAMLGKDRKVPHKLKTREQASRVAWRIIKDWLAAQMALLESELVTLPQVFLPYVQDTEGVTLYEKLERGAFNGLALPSPTR